MSDSTVKISQSMHGLASGIDDALEEITGERLGFTLIVFTPVRASYISNCERAEVIKEIKTLLEYWKQDMPDIPAHEVN